VSRLIPPAMIAAIEKPTVYPFFALDLEFDTDPLYLWTGVGSLSLDGNTYTGAGNFLTISEIQEGVDLAAKGATVSLSGIPSSLIAYALSEPYQGRPARIKFGVFDEDADDPAVLLMESGDALLMENGDRFDISYDTTTFAFELFSGRMDQMAIDEGAEEATIAVTIESRFIDLQRPRVRRYTDADQQSRYSGDLAFEFVPRLQEESLKWGS